LGLVLSTQANASLESCIHFPLPEKGEHPNGPCLATFCDANWGPQDASHPTSTNICPVSIQESKLICGHLFFYGGCLILWKTHKESRVSCSTCEAEIKATDECAKYVQIFRQLLSDLHLGYDGLTPVSNDNRGAVDWSHSFSTKGM
jgi:hypothetical protein